MQTRIPYGLLVAVLAPFMECQAATLLTDDVMATTVGAICKCCPGSTNANDCEPSCVTPCAPPGGSCSGSCNGGCCHLSGTSSYLMVALAFTKCTLAVTMGSCDNDNSVLCCKKQIFTQGSCGGQPKPSATGYSQSVGCDVSDDDSC